MRTLPGLLALLFLAPCLHADILVGPPQPLTAATNARAHEGGPAFLAADANGYLAVWTSGDQRVMGTRFDANGVRLDSDGLVLTDSFSVLAVTSSGSGWDVIGRYLRPPYGGYGFHVDEDGHASGLVPIDPGIAYSVSAAFNGSNYLVTWWATEKSWTQTLFGLLLDRDLHVVKAPFEIATRDLDPNVQYSGYSPILSNDVASDGHDFLVAWEQMLVNGLVLVPVSASGDVLPPGVTHFGTRVYQPTLAMTQSGYAVAWHDGRRISAAYANASGTLTTAPQLAVDAGNSIRELKVRSNANGTALAYLVQQHPGCNDISPVSSTAVLQPLDNTLSPSGSRQVLGPEDINTFLSLAGTANSFVGTWVEQECNTPGRTAAASVAGTRTRSRQFISDFLTPAPQITPAAASDGGSAVVVWSEQRVADAAAQVYAIAAGASGEGNAISTGPTQHANPRIAFDGRRYFAVWWNADRDGTIEGRFLGFDGAPVGDVIVIGDSRSANLDVVWTGSEYVVAWTSDGEVRAARVSASGEELSVTVAGNYATTGAIFLAAGAGEAVAAFEATTATSYLVESAVIHDRVSIAGTINSAKLGQCLSKDCEFGAKPLGIAWSGHDYLATSSIIHHPAYGYDVYATAVAVGGVPLATAIKHIRQSWSASWPMTGALEWTGSDYFFVMPVDQSNTGKFWLVRLDPAGTVESESTVSATGEVIPALAQIGPERYLLVYANGRIFTRAIDLAPAGPRRRTARR